MQYDPIIAQRVCDGVSDGLGLVKICAAGGMPSRREILRWLDDENNADFIAQYARARLHQADFIDEEMQVVADETNPEWAKVAQVRIGTMQWRAERMNRAKYGAKVDVTTNGKDIGNRSDEDLMKALAAKGVKVD